MGVTDTAGARPADAAPVQVAPRIAFAVAMIVYVGFAVNAFTFVLFGGYGVVPLVVATVCLLGLLGLQTGLLGQEIYHRGSGTGYAILVAQAVLVYPPLALFGMSWIGIPAFAVGSVLLVVRPAALRWSLFVLLSLLSGALVWFLSVDRIEAVYIVLGTAGNGVVIYGLARLNVLADRLRDARERLAELSVQEERERFEQEVERSIGRGIEGLGSLVGRALRLARSADDGAADIGERVVALARDSLARVRSVARSLRGCSLETEIGAVHAVLSAAGVTVRVEGVDVELDPTAEPSLVAALRVVVEDMLRHADVRRCAITVGRDGPETRLEVEHDGRSLDVDVNHPDATAAGTTTLRAGPLVAAVDRAADGTRRLVLRTRSDAPVDVDDGIASPSLRQAMSARLMAPRTVWWLLTALLVSQLGIGFLRLLDVGVGPTGLALGTLGVAVVLVAHVVHSRPPPDRATWLPAVVLAGQTVLVAALVVVPGASLAGLIGFVVAGALLSLRAPWNGIVVAVAVAGSAGVEYVLDGSALLVIYGVIAPVNIGLSAYGLTRLGSLVAGLHEARTALARAAVSQERTRFARDLHDLLGYSLSAVALKAELAVRLLRAGAAERAVQELDDVAAVLDRAAADLAGVSRGHRELTVSAELSSVRSVLSSAGIELTTDVDDITDDPLPDGVESDLATVLREAVSNLLRHADASRCRLVLDRDGDGVRLEVANDGVRAACAAGAEGGTGIASLTARMAARGGTTTTRRDPGGWFTLTARVPFVPRAGDLPEPAVPDTLASST